MANSRREYFRRTRKVRLRELKHSRQGIIAMIAAIAAAVLFVVSVMISYRQNGEGEYYVGSIGLIGLALAAGALILGILGIREPKVRPGAPRTGIVLGAVMTIVLGSLYAAGIH